MMTRATFCLSVAVICLADTTNASAPVAMDRGPLAARERQTPISVTVTLNLADSHEAEKLLEQVSAASGPYGR